MALVVLYRTRLIDLELLREIIKKNVPIILFDNGVSEEVKKIIESFCYESLVWLGNGDNVGLSVAYNNTFEYAKKNRYTHVYLFDQDSSIGTDYFDIANKQLGKLEGKNFGLLAPMISYDCLTQIKRKDKSIERVKWAISSGSLVSVNAVCAIGGFDERYFIDRVDAEFCYRINAKGYEIYKSSELVLFQKLGYSHKSVFGDFNSHSPIRHYYIARNRCLFYLQTCTEFPPMLYTFFMIFTLKHFFHVLLLEDYKIKKFRSIVIGLLDYALGRYGKIK